jgi:ribonuclease P protein component
MQRTTFNKGEKLTEKRSIDRLFSGGHSILSSPFRLIWLPSENKNEFPVRVLLHVPKRSVRLATKRNHIKRLMREVYRKNRDVLLKYVEEAGGALDLAVLYIPSDPPTYAELDDKMRRALGNLISDYEKSL